MPKPGEKRLHILQMLARMLEDPRCEKITTAALAARLECSEAALYRHFASKAQMFDGLIEFIETTLFGVINRISVKETDGLQQTENLLSLLLNFAQRNRGMTKVLTGEALVHEKERLQTRINQLHDRLEASLRQSLRVAAAQGRLPGNADFAALANLLLCYIAGRWQNYVKSGFTQEPAALWSSQWPLLRAACQYNALDSRAV
ncbi:MAG: nucleoid occlusion factor SlmA [Candidatus Accumulibacter sp.]|jgi:TetR/AcrR family transcriptional regulator|nr:nucleoid occlusion factor SlmA [Accumulibacter sp.]